MEGKMLELIRKAGKKASLIIPVLFIFALASANIVFAADTEDIGNSADKDCVQIAPEKQITASSIPQEQDAEKSYLQNNAARAIWSIVTPNEALASTSVIDCKAQCLKWHKNKLYCKKWMDNASQDCKDTYSKKTGPKKK